MSIALYNKGGLRFWNDSEIKFREYAVDYIQSNLHNSMKSINSAWNFIRFEGPLITPDENINSSYDGTDVWKLQYGYTLRPETTASSYLYAGYCMNNGLGKLPLCIWQHGKSFRVESADGASASKLRFNEFYQCEFQMLYSNKSKADYYTIALNSIKESIAKLTGLETRIVESDRLPSYSKKTMDVEVLWNDKWKEMCSVSLRTDYPDENIDVVEVAVGTDRLVSVYGL